jgi:methyl coenzyme M reductase gamma subunit
LNILPPAKFTIKGQTYHMHGANIEEDVVFFNDSEGKKYKMDFDTLASKIMADMDATGRGTQE